MNAQYVALVPGDVWGPFSIDEARAVQEWCQQRGMTCTLRTMHRPDVTTLTVNPTLVVHR